MGLYNTTLDTLVGNLHVTTTMDTALRDLGLYNTTLNTLIGDLRLTVPIDTALRDLGLYHTTLGTLIGNLHLDITLNTLLNDLGINTVTIDDILHNLGIYDYYLIGFQIPDFSAGLPSALESTVEELDGLWAAAAADLSEVSTTLVDLAGSF